MKKRFPLFLVIILLLFSIIVFYFALKNQGLSTLINDSDLIKNNIYNIFSLN